jgi:hypothetical protein
MNWRAWLHETLKAATDWPVHQGTTLNERPANRFVVYTFLPSTPGPTGVYVERVQVWAHDRNASLVAIDEQLQKVRAALESASAEEAFIGATWEGDSQDQTDDAMGTRTRFATFRLAARREQPA